MNIPEFSVIEFSRSIKRVVEDAFGYVRIKGEITGFKAHRSGHLYFSLQEEDALISAVCFRNMASAIEFDVENGIEVIASGRVTTYGGRSNYQIIVEKLEIAGIGAILEMIEKRRQKLQKEGLFDIIHKKSLPLFPKKIAVITSNTGAVIEDIKHRIEARYPVNLLIYNAAVQGKNAKEGVVSGVYYFNNLDNEKKPDLIIVARGGGSFEDLLPFNEEDIVRAVFKSQIPVISAIGHETDTTLIDYVADVRAPTPSAAAEIATPNISDLRDILANAKRSLNNIIISDIKNRQLFISNLKSKIVHPRQILLQNQQQLNFYKDKIISSASTKLNIEKTRLESCKLPKSILQNQINHAGEKLQNYYKNLNHLCNSKIKDSSTNLMALRKLLQNSNYKNILKRGFALIKSGSDVITSTSNMSSDSLINIEMHDGNVDAKIITNKR